MFGFPSPSKAVSGQILGYAHYNPSADSTYSNGTSTPSIVNEELSVVFHAPISRKVVVHLGALMARNGGATQYGVMENGVLLHPTRNLWYDVTTWIVYLTIDIVLTDLTPGMHKFYFSGANTTIYFGYASGRSGATMIVTAI